jgi:hypothetical protein
MFKYNLKTSRKCLSSSSIEGCEPGLSLSSMN